MVKRCSKAFWRLQIEAYLETLSDDTKDAIQDMCSSFRISYPSENFRQVKGASDVFMDFSNSFTEFVREECDNIPTFKF